MERERASRQFGNCTLRDEGTLDEGETRSNIDYSKVANSVETVETASIYSAEVPGIPLEYWEGETKLTLQLHERR